MMILGYAWPDCLEASDFIFYLRCSRFCHEVITPLLFLVLLYRSSVAVSQYLNARGMLVVSIMHVLLKLCFHGSSSYPRQVKRFCAESTSVRRGIVGIEIGWLLPFPPVGSLVSRSLAGSRSLLKSLLLLSFLGGVRCWRCIFSTMVFLMVFF